MKCEYESFMLKEIHEESKVFIDTINNYLDTDFKNIPNLTKYKEFHIVACGSAYHAGLVGKYLIENYANIPVNVEIASEYRYKKIFYNKKTLVILISQSGETADTLACLRKAKEEHIDTLSIVNVVGSSIARESKYIMYTKAGCEIAVATYKEIAKKINKSKNIFFIGRGIDYALCMEGALKLKEISYINACAYPAGELKHGTISLIEKDTPIIAISTDEKLLEKTISNIKEVKAREAKVIFITNSDIKSDFYDYLIKIPKTNSLFQSILTIIPLQIIAYEVAKSLGCDIDKPRNLAKSVTVE